ncbi:hypothetical protein BV113_00630 [Glutamicibacter phage BIM BV-113]|nr:hypothetical protein BV113_00630 [Glutamicibacter phage BIM BV-113]
MTSRNHPLSRLEEKYKAKGSKFIQIRPYKSFADQSFEYWEAAKRVHETYAGNPLDDTLIMPYLLLCRHSLELELKDLLIQTAEQRRRIGIAGPKDSSEDVLKDLKTKYRHKLQSLFDRVMRDFNGFASGGENPPAHLRSMVALLNELDPTGESFRYPDSTLDDSFNLDFDALHNDMAEMIKWLGALGDYYMNTITQM